ncbi:MAG TPA: ABC transporter permease, partial [Ignavibacteriales bacterium]|nr:ABC transporter permease [Ignavibacteriales bacterium]
MKTLLHIIKKEFLQFKRDPKMFALILVAPVLQLVLLGYAANLDVEVIHTAVYDLDKSAASRELIDNLQGNGYFAIDYYAGSYDEVTELIDKGKVIIAVVIPHDFEKMLGRKEPVKVQAIFDASDGNSSSIAGGYLQGVMSSYAANLSAERMNLSGMKLIPVGNITAETRVWYNPDLKTRNFMVPGIVALLLMIITLILTSLAVVKEKEIGTLEQLIVSPLKSWQIILGKLIPFALLGFVSVIVVITAMRIIFGINVRGSVFFLFGSSTIFVLSSLGMGLFISTITKTQQQAMMIAMFALMLPMMYLSGFAFPVENMPVWIQAISYAIPLKYFIIIIRGVILKGIGFAELWPETLIMLLMGIAILFLSAV